MSGWLVMLCDWCRVIVFCRLCMWGVLLCVNVLLGMCRYLNWCCWCICVIRWY